MERDSQKVHYVMYNISWVSIFILIQENLNDFLSSAEVSDRNNIMIKFKKKIIKILSVINLKPKLLLHTCVFRLLDYFIPSLCIQDIKEYLLLKNISRLRGKKYISLNKSLC